MCSAIHPCQSRLRLALLLHGSDGRQHAGPAMTCLSLEFRRYRREASFPRGGCEAGQPKLFGSRRDPHALTSGAQTAVSLQAGPPLLPWLRCVDRRKPRLSLARVCVAVVKWRQRPALQGESRRKAQREPNATECSVKAQPKRTRKIK